MTVKQLIQGLKKYNPDLVVVQGDVPIKAMRIHSFRFDRQGFPKDLVVRLIRQDEKRA